MGSICMKISDGIIIKPNKDTVIESMVTLCVYTNSNKIPDFDCLKENGKPYAYLAFIRLNNPNIYHISVPCRLEQRAIKSLTRKGYIANKCMY